MIHRSRFNVMHTHMQSPFDHRQPHTVESSWVRDRGAEVILCSSEGDSVCGGGGGGTPQL